MIKRFRKKLVANREIATINSTRGKTQSVPAKNVGALSSKVQTIKEPSLAPTDCLNRIESLQTHPIRLMQHQEESLALGQQINHIILNSSDAKSVLQQIAQVLGEAFAVDSCAIVITNEEKQQSQEQIGYWSNEDIVQVVPPQQKSGVEALASLLKADFEPLAIDDVQATARTGNLRQWQELSLPLRAVLKIPTYFQGRQNGVIALGRFQRHHWSDSERESAQIAAESVAIAILQIVQTQTIASLERYVDNSTQYQNAIDRLIMASRTSSDLNHILQLAISGTSQALQVERGLIITIKYTDPVFRHRPTQTIPKAKVTVISEWFGNSQLDASTVEASDSAIAANINNSSVVNQSFWLAECSLCQQALTTSHPPLIVNSVAELGEIDPQTDVASIFDFANFPNVLMFPLESQNAIFGFIVLQQNHARLWQSEDLSLLELVSAQVSTSIIQNQTLRQVQSLVEERTAQLQRSLDVQSKLFEKTRQQIDQLRQLNQLKDEFINTISHELRTPLTSMNLAIRMLRQPGIPAERQAKYLDILEEQCTQEINLINDLLTLQKLESHQAPLNLQTIPINTKLNELAQMFVEQWSEKEVGMVLDLPENLLSLQTDSDSFDRILHELLTNAGKYANPDTDAILKASQQGSQIILSITNIGPAIPPEDASYIFDKFRRGQGVTDQAIKGTGLGLALVKSLVQHLNGTIEVVSTPIENSSSAQVCFTLTLPQLSASN
ncbi:sensor histidine kinase [Aliterella atlantica]|uniref:sensor histidine kinase n=1 Tax=Aliterella atlantica TaxID=1827278 RepID=UPI0009E5785B|nr:GAF domain-containing sensor histidine kinase [Aliterella atlantica]